MNAIDSGLWKNCSGCYKKSYLLICLSVEHRFQTVMTQLAISGIDRPLSHQGEFSYRTQQLSGFLVKGRLHTWNSALSFNRSGLLIGGRFMITVVCFG